MAVETIRPAPDLEVLINLAQEYQKGPLTPELANTFWKTFLEISIKTRGLDIPVPVIECDRTQKELETLRKKGRMWVPETKLTYTQLGKIFPEMNNSAFERNGLIVDGFEQDSKGVDVEAGIKSPNRQTGERALAKILVKKERNGMRLSTYVLASQASKVLTGRHFDQDGTWSWLLGSNSGGYSLGARFDSGGRLYILWNLDPNLKGFYLGRRSERVRKVKKSLSF